MTSKRRQRQEAARITEQAQAPDNRSAVPALTPDELIGRTARLRADATILQAEAGEIAAVLDAQPGAHPGTQAAVDALEEAAADLAYAANHARIAAALVFYEAHHGAEK